MHKSLSFLALKKCGRKDPFWCQEIWIYLTLHNTLVGGSISDSRAPMKGRAMLFASRLLLIQSHVHSGEELMQKVIDNDGLIILKRGPEVAME